jgi:hypothetical protein
MARTDSQQTVHVTVDADGKVLRVRDPIVGAPRPWVNSEHMPRQGTVYGWDITPRLTGGQIAHPAYATTVAVAPNPPDDPAHRQTHQIQPAGFIKLDCGLWGTYDHPTRDFGLIEGENVWLCSYTGNVAPSGQDPAKLPAAGTIADALVQKLATYGKHLHFKLKLTVPQNANHAVPADHKLYICLPDMHLPEQWVDLYPASSRISNVRRRAELRRLLRMCQCKVGLLNDSLLTQANLDLIQRKLDAWERGSNETIDITFTVSKSVHHVLNLTYLTSNDVTQTYTKDEFLAEKAHLDREIHALSAWFYPVTPKASVAAPLVNPEEINPPLDNPHDDPIGNSPVPAVDLANFLFAVKELRTAQGADKVMVIQIGDLFELWMNREFLYFQHPNIPADEIGKFTAGTSGVGFRDGFVGVTAYAAIKVADMHQDSFQLRQDPNWTDSAGSHPAKHYPYHPLDQAQLYLRHNTAGSAGGAMGRLGTLLTDRLARVEDWTWPGPAPADHPDLIDPLKSWIRSKPAGFFQRTVRRGHQETRWNKMVLELLLVELNCKKIHGNHDGYRSDHALLAAGHRGACDPWVSETGVWFEHGHRWDYYNRDGVAMGAGMTNDVYYHNKEMVANSGTSDALFKQEQAFHQSGSAQWYLMCNYGHADSWFDANIRKWSVYVSGHTHNADLVRIDFNLANVDLVQQIIADKVQEARDAVLRMQTWLEEQRRRLARLREQIVQGIQDTAADARDGAIDMAHSARDGAIDLYHSAREGATEIENQISDSLSDLWPW